MPTPARALTSPPRPDRLAPERRCIVSGDLECKEGLVRFVVGPDGQAVPDLAGRLPGRGMWVGARRELIEQAVRRKAFSKAAKAPVAAAADLADQVERLLAGRCADVLGLCKRAGLAVAGHDKVSEWLDFRKVAVLLQASDGSPQGRNKLAARAANLPVVTILTREELGLALGRENVVHAALSPGGLTISFLVEAQRLSGFRSPISSLGASVAELA